MLLEVRNISKSYKKVPVVEEFSLKVEKGDMVALVGKRRKGKTTLMQMLGGIISPDEGEIYYDGRLVSRKWRAGRLCKLRRKKIGYVTTEAILMPDMTVYDNLLMALSHSRGSLKAKKSKAKEVLRTLGLKGKGRFFPKELSVLDRQKVCVGRAIINEPELLLCDEPTDILEGYGAEQMMDILEILNSAGYTIILTTHSKRVAGRCKKVYPIHEGLDLSGIARAGVVVGDLSEFSDNDDTYEEEDLEEEPLSGTYEEELDKGIEVDEDVAAEELSENEEKTDNSEIDDSTLQEGTEVMSQDDSNAEDGEAYEDISEANVESDLEELPEIDFTDMFK